MKISLHEANVSFSKLFFVALFWGYILYNFAILFGMPSFLGGYFGLATALGAVVFSLLTKPTIVNSFKASLFFSVLSLGALLCVIVVTATSYLSSNLSAARMQSLTLIVAWIALYCAGFYLVFSEKEKIRKLSIFLIYLFFGYAIYYVITNNAFMLPFVKGGDVDDENLASYQGIARNLLIIGILVIAYTTKRSTNLILAVVLGFILFLVGARSEFYAFILLLLSYHFLSAYKVKSSFIVIVLFAVVSAGLFINYYEKIADSRQLNITSVSKDESWQLRQQMQDFSIQIIKDHPVFGQFGGHGYYGSASGNNIGAYSHNALSGYTNYGLLFFILFIAMCYLSFIYSTLKFINNPKDEDWAFAFLLTFLIAFCITFSKSVYWSPIYLAWGVFMGTIYKDKFIKNNPRL